MLYRINRELRFEPTVKELFHTLRIEGNKATHRFTTKHKEALEGLKVARELAVWFHRSFGERGANFKPGPFVPPSDPSAHLRSLRTEISGLRAQLLAANEQLESNQRLAELLQREKDEYEELAEQMDAESRQLAEQARQHEEALARQKRDFEQRLKGLQAELAKQTEASAAKQKQQLNRNARTAAEHLVLDEELTRILIDQHLVESGWEADSQELTHKRGARPEKGVNRAIAEWPTRCEGKDGRADYVLFHGLIPVAVVEAKKENTNVVGKIPQAERYSRGLKVAPPLEGAWHLEGRTVAWPDEKDGHYHVPFVYSCNGRPFVQQVAEQSGTWFRDVRAPSHTARPHQQFPTPEGLVDKLKRSKEAAETLLKKEGFAYLKLRDYQVEAIKAVEATLEGEALRCLLAMATGTGKTRTIIGLMYRFLKAERFKRILFLVDRTSLGQQALDFFDEAPLEQNQSLSKIYNIAELGDMAAEAETRIQVATVQAMVKRVFMSDAPPPVDQFDCIIVDEAHRGYTLDQDMTEGELAVRDPNQYLSTYRRVLDYFDAVKVGLTATPAKHTSEIFGKPVYIYSYREAVAEDWLIDHEPPIRYETLLTREGIKFEKGEKVKAINTRTGEIETAELEDEMNFDVESFNRRVINENFNKVICNQLADELDPFGEEKTLIFCATDRHADMVKRLLDDAFKERYNGEYNQAAVSKITGQSDNPDQLIRQFKNERYPNIGITVDLLTTGIDVPEICHLVFLRRVRSRILYEQMIGRATRRCDEIGKTVFRIYDPVDIYATLEEVSTMKPLVKDPNVTIEQLVAELTDPEHLERAAQAPGESGDDTHADVILSQLSQKLMRVLRKAGKKAETKPELKQKLSDLHDEWGVEPTKLHQHLRQLGPQKAADFIRTHGPASSSGSPKSMRSWAVRVIRSSRITRMTCWCANKVTEFTKNRRITSTALPATFASTSTSPPHLSAVVNKPGDLTRRQLKEIRLLLDAEGYSEAKLQTAWREQTNQDIAASIIGHIRRAALDESLVPFEQRVKRAMDSIYARHKWTPAQRKWLERLAKQLTHEVIIDRETINALPAFRGGAKSLDKVLGHQLDDVLDELNGKIWEKEEKVEG